MPGENDTVAEIEQEAPASEAATEDDLPETLLEPGEEPETSDGEGDGEDGEPETVEYVTIERNGRQIQVPKELEGEFLMQADYTKKTQAVSERAKALESREAEINQRAEATEAELDARGELRAIDAQLAEYAKLSAQDWQYHFQNDLVGTQQARLNYETLKERKAELEGIVTKAQSERTAKAEQDLANRVQETTAFAQKEIPGWNPELTNTLVKMAIEEGVPEETLKAQWSPTLYKLLHLAHIGKTAVAKQAAAKPKPAPVAPLRTVSGKSTPGAAKSLIDVAASDDMEAYAAMRKAGRSR